MNQIKMVITLLPLVFLVACNTSPKKNDYKTIVEGLEIQTFSSKKQQFKQKLVIFLHGDRCSADYMGNIAKNIAETTNAVSILMARPGCSVGGKKSSGYHGDKDHYTYTNINMIEKAILSLKNHYSSSNVYLVGHSGGAATAGVIIGRNPSLVNGVVLVAFPADIDSWRIHRRGRNNWTSSLSPQDFISSIKKDTKVHIVSGSDDSNTTPELAERYVSEAYKEGINIEHTVIDDEDHKSIINSENVSLIVRNLVGE